MIRSLFLPSDVHQLPLHIVEIPLLPSSNCSWRPSSVRIQASKLIIVGLCWVGLVASATARNPLDPPALDNFTEVRQAWSKETYVQPLWEVAKGRSAIFTGFRAGDYDLVQIGRAHV